MSDVAAAVARLFLALIFVLSGFGKLVAVGGIAGALAKQGLPQPQVLGYLAGIVEFVGGLMILLGFKTRWAALALCAFTAITIVIGHNFWAADAPQYMAQRTQALKNLAIMGGFLMLYASGPGRYSVDARMPLDGRSQFKQVP